MNPSRGVTQSTVPAGVLDLGLGHPSDDLLPLPALRQAAAHLLDQGDPSPLQYGSEAGSAPLRALLAAFLTPALATPVQAESLFITNGVSQALDLLCTLYTRPGDTVIVEAPTYFLALRIFADHGLRVSAVPVDHEGLNIDLLEERLAAGERPALLYTVPTHQNPAGVTLSAERRDRLVALSRAYGFRILADEVYHLLTYEGAPPPPLAAWAHEPTVIALGSFSKILAPGLRLGWLHAAPETLARLSGCGLLDSGGGLNPFTGAVVQSLLEMGLLEPNLAHLRTTYRTRRDALTRALHTHLPHARLQSPTGGYFVWVDLGDGVDAAAVAAQAEAAGVNLRAGARFAPAGAHASLRSFARLCFAYYAPHDLAEGVRRLATLLPR